MNEKLSIILILLLLSGHQVLFASETNEEITLAELKASERLFSMSWEELMDVEILAATRRPTKMRYIAENISIITAEEIVEMNAHSVNEILRTVPAIYLAFFEYYSGHGSNYIHASNYEHVLILLDGVRINDADQGYTDTTGIPVQIIDRIEIVKGPASSAWGTALGGIINIITKSGGDDLRPTGTVYASYGEGNSRDYRIDAVGRAGKVSYYLYGGFIETDGLKSEDVIPDHFYESKSFYGKISFDPSRDVSMTLSTGYWSPDTNLFDLPDSDERNVYGSDNYYVSGKMEAALSPDLNLNLNIYYFDNEISNHGTVLGTDTPGSKGDLIYENIYDNSVYGGDARLTWDKDRHTMAFGVEYYYGENDRSARYGTLYQSFGALPEEDLGKDDIRDLGVFVNDTIKFNSLTITPGLRYDQIKISDSFSEDRINPSLGMTWNISEDTLIRATVAQGFARPGIAQVSGYSGTFGFPADPDHKSETIRSYQAGIETARIQHLHLKADLFYHHTDDSWFYNDDAGYFDNGGVSKRKGFELNATASPVENFTAGLAYTYIRVEPYDTDAEDYHSLSTRLRYSDRRIGSLTLFGKYLRVGEFISSDSAEYKDMIWDIHYNKDIFSANSTNVNLFLSARNLFNGDQYWAEWFRNPRRWFEGGVRVNF